MKKQNWREEVKELMVKHLIATQENDMSNDLFSGQIITPVENFIATLLKQQKEEIAKKVHNHHKSNTYEGNEALVFHTTVNEIIELLKE